MPWQSILLAVLPATALALALLLASWRPWKGGNAASGWWGSALAVGLGFALSDRLVWHSWPRFPPAEEHRWLPLIGLAGAAFGLLEPFWRGRELRTYAMAGLSAACMAPLLWADLSRKAAVGSALLWLAIWTAACTMLWAEASAPRGRPAGARTPLLMWISATGAALVSVQSNALSLGLTAGALAAICALLVVLAWTRPALAATTAAIPPYALLLVGLLVAHQGTSLPATALVIASGATAGLADGGPFRRLPPWAATLACLVTSALLIAAALHFTPRGFDFGEGE